MKKLFALLLALTMMISCISAFAEQAESAATQNLSDAVKEITTGVEKVTAAVEETAEAALDAAEQKAQDVAEAVTETAEAAVDAAEQKAQDVAEAVTETAEATLDTAEQKAQDVAEAVTETAEAAVDAAEQKAQDVAEAVTETAEAALDAAEQTAQDVTEAVTETAEAAAEAAAETTRDVQQLLTDDAPEDVPTYAVRSQISYSLGSDFVNNILLSRLQGTRAGSIIESLLNLLNKAYLDVISSRAGADIALMINDKPVCTLKGVMEEDGMAIVSTLFPSFAIKLSFEDVAALAQRFNLAELSDAAPAEEAPELTEEEAAELNARMAEQQAAMEERMAVLSPYLSDVNAFVENVQQSARFSEDYSTMNVELTAGQLNDLVQSISTRLSTDENALSYLQGIVDKINAVMPADRQMSADALISQLLAVLQNGTRMAPDTSVARLTINNHDDGTGVVELNTMDRMLMTRETTKDGTVTTMLFSNNQIGDGSRMLGSLRDGSDKTDMGMVITTRNINTENGITSLTDTDAYLQGVNVQVRNMTSEIGTGDDAVSHRSTTISLPQLGGEVLTYSINTCSTDVPAQPSLEGLQELRLNELNGEQVTSLVRDIMSNGISALTADVVRAMPEEVARLLDSRKEQTQDASQDRAWINTEPVEDENKPVEIVGTWTASNGSVVIRPDGSCTVNYNGTQYEADYMNYDGTIFLTHESSMVTGTYTNTTMTLNFGFDVVEYTR